MRRSNKQRSTIISPDDAHTDFDWTEVPRLPDFPWATMCVSTGVEAGTKETSVAALSEAVAQMRDDGFLLDPANDSANVLVIELANTVETAVRSNSNLEPNDYCQVTRLFYGRHVEHPDECEFSECVGHAQGTDLTDIPIYSVDTGEPEGDKDIRVCTTENDARDLFPSADLQDMICYKVSKPGKLSVPPAPNLIAENPTIYLPVSTISTKLYSARYGALRETCTAKDVFRLHRPYCVTSKCPGSIDRHSVATKAKEPKPGKIWSACRRDKYYEFDPNRPPTADISAAEHNARMTAIEGHAPFLGMVGSPNDSPSRTPHAPHAPQNWVDFIKLS